MGTVLGRRRTEERTVIVKLKIIQIVATFSAVLLLSDPNHVHAITDTDQELCYSVNGELTLDLESTPCWTIAPSSYQGTYGQDGHYTQSSKPSYVHNLDGTVTDHESGLTWQSSPGCFYRTWQDSIDYCENLSLAGHEDWRLPSRHELTTILDYSRWRPVLNTTYFDHCVSSDEAWAYYWTRTVKPNDTSYAYIVEFQHGGSLGQTNIEWLKNQSHLLRCVRGETLPVSQLVDNLDGTITDNNTGLMWQQGSQPFKTPWDGNLEYCENLELAGYTDWRLPNIRELESLVDDSRYHPSIDPIFEYWGENPSSTTIPIDPERNLLPAIASLCFEDNGGIIDSSKRNSLTARCVRSGPPSDYWSKEIIENANNLQGFHFINSLEGWAVGSQEQVLRTVDGGDTWSVVHSNGVLTYNDVSFVTSNFGWVFSNIYGLYGRGHLYRSDNGGTSWVEQWTESTGYYKDLFFVNENIGWIIKSNGIYKTLNGGQSWVDQSNELVDSLSSIFFLDDQTGWVVGKVILKTENGGANWAKQYECELGVLSSVFFSDQNNGWAVGSSGQIVRTTNGGETWGVQVSGTDLFLNAVSFADEQTGFIFGSYGLFLVSTDGGITWARKYGGPPPLSVSKIQMVQGVTGYGIADTNALLKLRPALIPIIRGDLNHDGIIDLRDLIVGLKTICGFDVFAIQEADVNEDGKVGIEEAIYILQHMSDSQSK